MAAANVNANDAFATLCTLGTPLHCQGGNSPEFSLQRSQVGRRFRDGGTKKGVFVVVVFCFVFSKMWGSMNLFMENKDEMRQKQPKETELLS